MLGLSENVAEKTQKWRTYQNNWQRKSVIDWWTLLEYQKIMIEMH